MKRMDIEEKIKFITKNPIEEVLTLEELRELLQTKENPVAYDGFEPSGMAHLGTGLMRAEKIKDLQKAGVKFKLYVADWHGWINNKMNGDLDLIKKTGKYLIKVWESLGVDTKKVEIIWASDLVNDSDYWKRVVEISKATTMKRMMRCTTIMGRKEGELSDAGQLLYPAMQVADIFHMNIDICQLGMDQRKANVLARELGPKLGWWKPVVLNHHLIMGLQGPARMEMDAKMSKSKPDSAIFVHDSPEEIERKLKKAHCPEGIVEGNPVIEYFKYIIFRGDKKEITINRPEKFGGNISFNNQAELEKIFIQKKLHPLDLKNKLGELISDMLEPCRRKISEKDLEIFKKV